VTAPDLVIPSAGRPSLARLLEALAPDRAAFGRVIVVDDAGRSLSAPPWATVVRGTGRGPAAARNLGWRAGTAE
jgi:hypothetical protein